MSKRNVHMNTAKALREITKFYLTSRDFNGITLDDLAGEYQEKKQVLEELLREGKINLNFGDNHPNPHILAFEPEPREAQIEKLRKLEDQEPEYKDCGSIRIQMNWSGCCIYPSREHMSEHVKASEYSDRPYTRLLALGEPQLSYRSFNLRVLEFYRNDPRYHYNVDGVGGSICVKDEDTVENPDSVLLETFGFSFNKGLSRRYVAAFLIYLSRLTPEHQQRWKLDEISEKTFLHPNYAMSTCGQWPERISVIDAFCEEQRLINEMTLRICGKRLFLNTYDSQSKPKEFNFLIRPTERELGNFIQLLDKMLSDNIDRSFFDGQIPLKKVVARADGTRVEENKGTITLLNDWINSRVRFIDPEPKEEMIRIFRDIRKKRSPRAHVDVKDKWDESFFKVQRELILDAYKAVRTLRLILANHPAARQIEVPNFLFEGKIWDF